MSDNNSAAIDGDEGAPGFAHNDEWFEYESFAEAYKAWRHALWRADEPGELDEGELDARCEHEEKIVEQMLGLDVDDASVWDAHAFVIAVLRRALDEQRRGGWCTEVQIEAAVHIADRLHHRALSAERKPFAPVRAAPAGRRGLVYRLRRYLAGVVIRVGARLVPAAS